MSRGYRCLNRRTTATKRDEHADETGPPEASEATVEEGDDDVVRDGEQPPLDQDKATGQVLGVLDLQARRVVRDRLEGERGIAVGAESAVRVERVGTLVGLVDERHAPCTDHRRP